MIKTTLSVVFLGLVLLSTSCKEKQENLTDSTSPQVSAVEVDSQFEFGTYQGTIPCASCPGINQTLILNKDKTYTLESVYLGNEEQVFKDSGTYSIGDGKITLSKDAPSMYKIGRGYVEQLDIEGKEIEGELKPLYKLVKK